MLKEKAPKTIPVTENELKNFLDDQIRYFADVFVRSDNVDIKIWAENSISTYQTIRTHFFGEILPDISHNMHQDQKMNTYGVAILKELEQVILKHKEDFDFTGLELSIEFNVSDSTPEGEWPDYLEASLVLKFTDKSNTIIRGNSGTWTEPWSTSELANFIFEKVKEL